MRAGEAGLDIPDNERLPSGRLTHMRAGEAGLDIPDNERLPIYDRRRP
jgi:hypothetical protein